MIKCWLVGHDWSNWDADRRFCHRCGKEQRFDFSDSTWKNALTVLLIFTLAAMLVEAR